MWPAPPIWSGPNSLDNWWTAPTAAGRRVYASNGRTFMASLVRAIRTELQGTATVRPPPRPGASDGTVQDATTIAVASLVDDGRWTPAITACLYEIAVRIWNSSELQTNRRSNLSADDERQLQEDFLFNQIGVVSLRVACWLLTGRASTAYNAIFIDTSAEPPSMGIVWQGADTSTFTIFDPATGPVASTGQTQGRASTGAMVAVAAIVLVGVGAAMSGKSKRKRRRR